MSKNFSADYNTVGQRMAGFFASAAHDGWTIESELLSDGPSVLMRAVIKDAEGRIRGTGHAEEKRDSSFVNKTSAIENCETSAWGRALAAVGFLPKDEVPQVATIDEIKNAITQQVSGEFVEYQACVKDHFDVIETVKREIANDDVEAALAAWRDLDEDTMKMLWKAPTKGGIFTIAEREALKTNGRKAA